MAITLTEHAARRVHTLLSRRGALGLRLAVKTSGCSGMAPGTTIPRLSPAV